MAYCRSCGTQVAEDVKFCPNCGAATPTAKQSKPFDFSQTLHDLNNTADTTASFDPMDVQQNKIMGILAYISWLVLIPIFAAKNSRFARFHANQGLVLAITEAVWWASQSVLYRLLRAISWRLGFLASLMNLANIVFVLLMVLGIINAARGRAKELPVIGRIRILK